MSLKAGTAWIAELLASREVVQFLALVRTALAPYPEALGAVTKLIDDPQAPRAK